MVGETNGGLSEEELLEFVRMLVTDTRPEVGDWPYFRSKANCWRCGKRLVLYVENDAEEVSWNGGVEAHHMIPLSKGGERVLENLSLLCLDCHSEVTRKMGEMVGNYECGCCGSVGKVKGVEESVRSVQVSLVCPKCRNEFVVEFH